MDDWDSDAKRRREQFKWEIRQKEIDNLQKRWLEEDIKEGQLKQDFNPINRNLNLSNINKPDNFQIDFTQIENEHRAQSIKWDVRQNIIDDLKKRWLEEDLIETNKAIENRHLLNDFKNNKY